jgi:hypothetical protein
MRARSCVPVVAVAALLLGLAGCGDEDIATSVAPVPVPTEVRGAADASADTVAAEEPAAVPEATAFEDIESESDASVDAADGADASDAPADTDAPPADATAAGNPLAGVSTPEEAEVAIANELRRVVATQNPPTLNGEQIDCFAAKLSTGVAPGDLATLDVEGSLAALTGADGGNLPDGKTVQTAILAAVDCNVMGSAFVAQAGLALRPETIQCIDESIAKQRDALAAPLAADAPGDTPINQLIAVVFQGAAACASPEEIAGLLGGAVPATSTG